MQHTPLEKSWTLTHTQTHTECEVFQSKDGCDEPQILLIGSIPLEEIYSDAEDCPYTVMFDQIHAVFGKDTFHDELNIECEVVPLSFESKWELPIRSYRVLMHDLDDGMVLPIDIHSFCEADRLYYVVASVFPLLSEESLTAFSQMIIDGFQGEEVDIEDEPCCCDEEELEPFYDQALIEETEIQE